MWKYVLGLFAVVVALGVYIVLSSGVSERPENAVIKAVHYVGISVNDLEKSSELYETAFGLTRVRSSTLENEPAIDALVGRQGVSANTRLLRSSNAQLRLMAFQGNRDDIDNIPPQEVKGPGFAHVCVQVNQKNQAYDKFLAGGAEAIGDKEMVQLNSRNPVYYAYARDPDNTIFEVEHVDIDALNLETPPKNDYRMRHVALASPDIDASVEFYSVLLEQDRPRRLGRFMAMEGEKFDAVSGLPGTKLKMAFFQLRNMELEIAQYLSHPTEAPVNPRPLEANGYNMIVFEVSSLNAAKKLLVKAGGAVVTDILPMDEGQIFFARDLDNNLLGFQMLEDNSPLSAVQFTDNGMN